MRKLVMDTRQGREPQSFIYPRAEDQGEPVTDSVEEYDRVSLMVSSTDHSAVDEVVEKDVETGLVIPDPFNFPLESIGGHIGYVEVPFLVTSDAYQMLKRGSQEEIAAAVRQLKNRDKEVVLHVPLLKPNYRELEDAVKFAVTFSIDRMIFTFPEPRLSEEFGGLTPNMTRMMDYLKGAVDRAILKDIDVEVRDVPLCQMVGYKRYLSRFNDVEEHVVQDGEVKTHGELRRQEKFKPGQCNIHKMLGPTGMGVLYGKRWLLDEMDTFMVGGDTVRDVDYLGGTGARVPRAATEVRGRSPELRRYRRRWSLGRLPGGYRHEEDREPGEKATGGLYDEMKDIGGINIMGPGKEKRRGLVAFTLEARKVSEKDLAEYLSGEHQVYLRAGHHCVSPFHHFNGIDPTKGKGTVRASLYFYNTEDEILRLKRGVEGFLKKLNM